MSLGPLTENAFDTFRIEIELYINQSPITSLNHSPMRTLATVAVVGVLGKRTPSFLEMFSLGQAHFNEHHEQSPFMVGKKVLSSFTINATLSTTFG
jgi:hypothetical protein